MGGYDGALKNDVYSSSDGISRGTVTGAASFVPRDYFSGVEFDNGTGNKLWVIGGGRSGGYNNDVWYSANGAAWGCTTTAAAFPGRFSHACAVFDEGTGNKMWVIGGYDGNNSVYLKDVWYSSNGADWTNATGNAAFGLRDGASSVVFAGRLWVIAGYDGTQSCKDVWYTMNGADWIQATGNAAFGRRMGHSSVVYDNKMWVIGGVDGIFYFNDVWYSTNGADWVQATPNGVFMRRAYHSSMVMNGKVYVLGGVASGGTRLNDVWQSQ
jgi:N-acetylneuraminic acid mutarotase